MKKPAIIASFIVITVFVVVWFTSTSTHKTTTNKVPKIQASELKPGGDTTVSIKPYPSLMLATKNLAQDQKPSFHAGKALAHQPWIKAPATTKSRDGLGPLFNARTCLTCHVNGGRGLMPTDSGELLFTSFIRLSIPGNEPINGVIPEPTYGDQLQTQSISLKQIFKSKTQSANSTGNFIAAEAKVYINWIKHIFTYPDSRKIELRKPQIILKQLAYGKMHPDTMMGIRSAPPIHGVGLLQLIEQQDLNKLTDEDDINNDGISGRVNIVWDFDKHHATPGRFGLKANKSSVRFQVAGALHGDMGISSSVFPSQPCTEKQIRCNQSIHGIDTDKNEINDELLDLIVNFNMSLGVPERRKANHPMVLQGRELFYAASCHACHHPEFTTGRDNQYPHLSQQTIWPYTDLLLHDMGEDLADGRSDYLATGSEWRTAPLWSVGLSAAINGSNNFLHDGRARNIEEAILWHSGEAETSKLNFTHLSYDERSALISFVKSL